MLYRCVNARVQVGKTSMMVKYVEGNFDEDYIETLGTTLALPMPVCVPVLTGSRCELHGENGGSSGHRNHV